MDTLTKIRDAIAAVEVPFVAVDGMCASGKTTLAEELGRLTSLPIIHADHFFLQQWQRSEARMREAGGNIDRERMYDEVISKLGQVLTYLVFSCRTGRLEESITVDTSRGAIIEGSYSLHPYFGKYYTLSVFCFTDADTQLRRIIERNGAAALDSFKQKWIPSENAYFAAFDIKNNCDILFST